MENKYTVKIALVVLTILIAWATYTGYTVYKNSPEWKAQQMLKAQEELLAEIAKDQAQMAEEAKALISEMERKKKEQEKIYQAYLSGAKMDQAELNRIQDRLKNLEYCEAMMSYECFSNTASGAPLSSAPSHRYQLITTAYAYDTSDTIDSNTNTMVSSKKRQVPFWSDYNDTRSPWTSRASSQRSLSGAIGSRLTDMPAQTGDRDTQKTVAMSKQHTDASLTSQGQETARSQALELIRKYEWLRLTAYPDGNGYSIGYGSRSYAGEKISKQEAERRLQYLVDQLITKIRKDYPKSSDNKIAALTSLRYNCERCYKRITAKVKKWEPKIEYWKNGAGGRQLKGLLKRRAEEVELFLR